MRAFKVYLNGKRLCLAGIGDDGVLTTIVDWVSRKGVGDLFLQVGGLISPKDEHVRWVTQKPLTVGDQLRVEIVEADAVDRPKKRYRTHPAEQLKSKKRYVRMMAKELGWGVRARPKRPKT